jgi:hypothetical protein
MGRATEFSCVCIVNSVAKISTPNRARAVPNQKTLLFQYAAKIWRADLANRAILLRHELGICALCCKCDIAAQHLKIVSSSQIC